MSARFLRIRDLVQLLGVSRPTIYRWEADGILPPRRQIGPNSVGWLDTEIEEFIQNRPAAGHPGARAHVKGS